MTSTTSKREMAPRTRRALASLLVGVIASLPALALGALGIILVEPDNFVATAGCIAITAVLVVMATAAGGMRLGTESNIGLCMVLGTGALLAVGFPVFVTLEPVWWRFACGMVGPLLVAAAIAYGAPRAARDDGKVLQVARAWLTEPMQLVWRVLLSLVGKDATVRPSQPARR